MTVRAFITSDILNCSIGGLTAGVFGTQAAIVKRAATGAWTTFMAYHNSGGSALTQFGYNNTNQAAIWIDGTTVTGPAALATTDWGLIVVRKVTGTATPRFSIYNFTSAAWTHANASGTLPNWVAPGAGATVRAEWESFDRLNGRIAVRAAWNSVPWTSDASGDTAIQSAGLHTSLQNWVNATPSALWAFNQASVGTAVTDLTGGGANQSSITGTTAVNGDDPPGFSFGGTVTSDALKRDKQMRLGALLQM